MPNPWSEWWWIKILHFRAWSTDERAAAAALWITFFLCLVGIALFGWFAAVQLKLSSQIGIAGGLILGFVCALAHVRGVCWSSVPQVVSRGDVAAAKRTGGVIVIKPKVPRFWWADWRYTHRPSVAGHWSDEEVWTRNATCGLAAIFFVIPISFELPWLASLGFSKNATALTIVFVQGPLCFAISRLICILLWPDYLRQADQNAMNRAIQHAERQSQAPDVR